MPAARAAVLLDAGADPQLTDIQIREPVGDEVLVRVDAVGICHTDVSVAARWPAKRLPMVFGHEGAGTVSAVGPDAALNIGQPVLLTFASCGRCGCCAADAPAYCEQSTGLNMRGSSGALQIEGADVTSGFFGQSSFATYALARQGNTVVLPDGIDPALAAPLGCSVQTGVGTVLNALAAGPGDAIVIFGAGAVGLSAVMGARIAGCRSIVAVDPVAERRGLAATLGATATLDPAEAQATLAELGATAAIDTTAKAEVLATAIAALRPRGTLAVVGLGAPMAELPVGLIMGKGLTVRGVVEGDSNPDTFIPELAERWQRGELPLEKLVTRYPFDEFDQAWTAAKTGSVVKPVLVTGR